MPKPVRGGARLEIVPGDRLEAMRHEWTALWQRCPAATPFQSPAWLLPWMRHHAPGRCGAAALRAGDRLVGLLPVFTWRGSLLLAGTGPSDYGDCLLDPDAGLSAEVLLTALADLGLDGFERIDLRQLPPGSPLASVPAPPGWTARRDEDAACMVAPLNGDDGVGAASKSCRSNWRYAMRRIAREGGTVELVPPEDVPQAMRELARLHALRWREKGESGVLSDPLMADFLADAAPELSRSRLLRLYRVRFEERTAAVLMALAGRRAHFYYIGGFDPAYAPLSPSAALVGAAMGQAAREGAVEFDFLRGCESYKRRWGAEERATCRRTLSP